MEWRVFTGWRRHNGVESIHWMAESQWSGEYSLDGGVTEAGGFSLDGGVTMERIL